MMTIKAFAVAFQLLSGASAAKPSQEVPITSIGLYLDLSDYDQSAFALMEEAEEALQDAFPGISWQTIDSSDAKVRKLPSPLPVLGRLSQPKLDSQALRMGQATAQAYAYSHLLLLQRSGAHALRDSSQEFGDEATFTLIEARSGQARFQYRIRTVGQKASKSSAEASWARNAWTSFVKAWKAKPQSP